LLGLLFQGAWDQSSAGGALGRPLFYTNPQYAVVLTQKTKVHIEVRAPKDVSETKIGF
ncbi:unnamed protein product, partial [Ectocarpus sp. 13 AM-2016]